jgi:hypothetical protein
MVLAAVLAVISAPASAAQKRPSSQRSDEAVYRCKSVTGQYYYGQNIPAECMNADIEVLDRSGRVLRVIAAPKSPDELAREKAAEDAKKAAALRDKTLLDTYGSVDEIVRLRDQRIEQIDQQNLVTQQYISSLRERESRLMSSVQRFRPYSPKATAPALPEQIAEEIINTVKGLQVYQQELAKNNGTRDKLVAEFNADIARFKELRRIK